MRLRGRVGKVRLVRLSRGRVGRDRHIRRAIAPTRARRCDCGPAQYGSSSFGHSLLLSLRFAPFPELDGDLHQNPSHDHGA